MKREELLRQLDETVDRLKEELEETTKQLQKFTAEESQRVPKWAKPTKVEDDKYFLANHWYHMEHPWKSGRGNGWVWHSLTKTSENLVCQELNDWGFGVKEWDLCYDDNPPEEKKQDDPAEILRKRVNDGYWSASVPGYKIVYLRGDINSEEYVAIITDGSGQDNTLLLVGKSVMGNFRGGVSYLGYFDK